MKIGKGNRVFTRMSGDVATEPLGNRITAGNHQPADFLCGQVFATCCYQDDNSFTAPTRELSVASHLESLTQHLS